MTGLALSPADAAGLRESLRSSVRARRLKAFFLIAPLLAFVAIVFLAPICLLLGRSVAVPEIPAALLNTARALADWDAADLPAESAWEALVLDLRATQEAGTTSKLATTLNQDIAGIRSLVIKTGRESAALTPPFRTALTRLDERWADPMIWGTLKRLSEGLTMSYYANALDMRIAGYDRLERQPEGRRIYLTLFARTLKVAGLVTLICLALAYPLANLLAGLSSRGADVLMVLVLLPFCGPES